MAIYNFEYRCAVCGSTEVEGQAWVVLNKIEPLPDVRLPDDKTAGVAMIDAQELAWDVDGYKGAWCHTCDEHVECVITERKKD